MNSTSETGHYKNVAEFGRLVNTLSAIGNYKPTHTSLLLSSLQALHLGADTLMSNLKSAEATLKSNTQHRATAFDAIPALATRIYNTLLAANGQSSVLPAAKAYLDKLRGIRRTALPKAPENGAAAPATISVSQQSYDALLEHLKGLVTTVKEEPAYGPNEADMKPGALDLLVQQLTQQNAAVAGSAKNVEQLRMQRNELLYKEPDGLVPRALAVKAYLKGAFGTQSTELKLVSDIHFTNPH